MRRGLQRRWDRLGVRSRLRSLIPPRGAEPPPDDEGGRRGLAMGLSVVVAVVLWFSFSMRESYSVTVELPVEVVRLPDGQALREPPPASTTVTLDGEGWTLLGFSRRRPTIQVEADDDATVDLGAALQRQVPAGVAVRAVQPRRVALALDAETTRRLPIRLRRNVETRPSYGLLRPPTLQPDSVVVSGAQSLLGRLTDWPTEMLVARDVDADLRQTVALSDTFGGLLSPSVEATTVTVEVGQFTRAERDLDVEVEGLPPRIADVTFDPPRVTASFDVPSAGEAYDEALVSDAFRAVVDWADIARDSTSGSVPVSLRVPPGLGIRDATASPSRVEYFISRRPAPPDPEGQ